MPEICGVIWDKNFISQKRSNVVEAFNADLLNIIWELSSELDNEQIMLIAKHEHIQNFVLAQFKTLDQRLMYPCIRTIGNFIAVCEDLCSQFVSNGLLDVLKKVFTFCAKHIRKEALWLVSNIAANSEEDAIKIIDSSIIINLIYACKDNTYETRKEAMWALSNICFIVNSEEKLNQLIDCEVMHCFIDIL
jgi:hypothetical protein